MPPSLPTLITWQYLQTYLIIMNGGPGEGVEARDAAKHLQSPGQPTQSRIIQAPKSEMPKLATPVVDGPAPHLELGVQSVAIYAWTDEE